MAATVIDVWDGRQPCNVSGTRPLKFTCSSLTGTCLQTAVLINLLQEDLLTEQGTRAERIDRVAAALLKEGSETRFFLTETALGAAASTGLLAVHSGRCHGPDAA